MGCCEFLGAPCLAIAHVPPCICPCTPPGPPVCLPAPALAPTCTPARQVISGLGHLLPPILGFVAPCYYARTYSPRGACARTPVPASVRAYVPAYARLCPRPRVRMLVRARVGPCRRVCTRNPLHVGTQMSQEPIFRLI